CPNQRAHWHMATLQIRLMLNYLGLIAMLVSRSCGLLSTYASYSGRTGLDVLAIPISIVVNGEIVAVRVERAYISVRKRQVIQDRLEPGIPKCLHARCLGYPTSGQSFNEVVHICTTKRLALSIYLRQLNQC